MDEDESTDLVNQCPPVNVVANKNLSPKVGLTALDEVSCLLFEHGIVIRDGNELLVTKSLCVCDVCQIRIACLTEFTDNQRFVQLSRIVSLVKGMRRNNLTHIILFKESLRVIVTVDVDLGHSVVKRWVLAASLNASFKPGKNEF